jgi:hypothetical protein
MPCVWWPWACQLLAVDVSTAFVELDLVTSEPRPVRGAVVEAGTPFSIRVTGGTESSPSDLPVVTGWLEAGAAVTVLAGRHERSSWVCLGVGHRRIVLNNVVSNLGLDAPIEREVTVTPGRETLMPDGELGGNRRSIRDDSPPDRPKKPGVSSSVMFAPRAAAGRVEGEAEVVLGGIDARCGE